MEENVVPEQPRVQPEEATGDELQLDTLEVRQHPLHIGRTEQVEMGGVGFRRPASEESETILQTEGVRHRACECAVHPKDAQTLRDQALGFPKVLQQLPDDDGVEALALKRERLFCVCPHRRDPESRSLFQRVPVDVHSDNIVPICVGTRERSVPATNVKYAPTRSAYIVTKEI
jgi:hypothetical protein